MVKQADRDAASGRSGKSAAAFRTISEVAQELDLPAHVLRFWESKFAQVKPVKRAGRRRYYRREDIDLLRCIKDLLYIDGYTIKGVQKLLREGGIRSLRISKAERVALDSKTVSGNSALTEATELLEPAERKKVEQILADLEEIRDLLGNDVI